MSPREWPDTPAPWQTTDDDFEPLTFRRTVVLVAVVLIVGAWLMDVAYIAVIDGQPRQAGALLLWPTLVVLALYGLVKYSVWSTDRHYQRAMRGYGWDTDR